LSGKISSNRFQHQKGDNIGLAECGLTEIVIAGYGIFLFYPIDRMADSSKIHCGIKNTLKITGYISGIRRNLFIMAGWLD